MKSGGVVEAGRVGDGEAEGRVAARGAVCLFRLLRKWEPSCTRSPRFEDILGVVFYST